MITHILPHELKQPISGAMLWSQDSVILFGGLDCDVTKRFTFFFSPLPPLTLQFTVVMTLLVI